MIKIKRINDNITYIQKGIIKEIQQLFKSCFKTDSEQRYADEIPKLLYHSRDFETILLVAEEEESLIHGFALCFFFPKIKYSYLDYIACKEEKRNKGLGSVLYQSLKEILIQKKAKGLFLEAYRDDCKLEEYNINKSRNRFYEKNGARPILNTAWKDVASRTDWEETNLLFDSLNSIDKKQLSRKEAKKVVQKILTLLYDFKKNDDLFIRVLNSFKDDPIKIRPKIYKKSEISFDPQRLDALEIIFSGNISFVHSKEKGYVEKPSQVKLIKKALSKFNLFEHSVNENFINKYENYIELTHCKDYIAFLKDYSGKLDYNKPKYCNYFNTKNNVNMNKLDNLGNFAADATTPLFKDVYSFAKKSALTAIKGAKLLKEGKKRVYSLTSLPGHFASESNYSGFCYLNNAAISANYLKDYGRVVILDLDFHHGSGTQEIFYRDSEVIYISIHGNPKSNFPFFSGYENENGKNLGKGYNYNFPLQNFCGDNIYFLSFYKVIEIIKKIKPDYLLISLGFDIIRNDPTGNFNLTFDALYKIGLEINKLAIPVLIVQEGEYNLRKIDKSVKSFFKGFLLKYK